MSLSVASCAAAALPAARLPARRGAGAAALLRTMADGGAAQLSERDGIAYLTGSLWTARQRQGHSLHEISYRACFKPQLPEFFISRLTRRGGVVLDPFLGRGTTAIQAALMGRVALGGDANPLSAMLTRPRLRPPPPDAVLRRLRQIPAAAPVAAQDEHLAVFFHARVLEKLSALKNWFGARTAMGELDATDEWIRMVALNRLTGHSPGFFSVKTMPPNLAVSARAQMALNAKHGREPPPRDVDALIMKKTLSLQRHLRDEAARVFLADLACADARRHRVFCANAAELREVQDGAVDLVATSPPFLDVVDYARDNWLRCWFAGIEARALRMAHYKNADEWQGFVAAVLGELARVTRRGGHVAFEVGEARRGAVLLEHAVLRAAANLPLVPLAVVINQQRFTKTANCWGVHNNVKGTNTNRVVLFQRV